MLKTNWNCKKLLDSNKFDHFDPESNNSAQKKIVGSKSKHRYLPMKELFHQIGGSQSSQHKTSSDSKTNEFCRYGKSLRSKWSNPETSRTKKVSCLHRSKGGSN